MKTTIVPSCAVLATCFALTATARAEIPLPPHVVFGRLAEEAEIVAVVERDGLDDLVMAGEVTTYQDELFYVLRVSMETDIGAPGPSGEVARVGDRLLSLEVDGVPLSPEEFPLLLATAEITQIDFVTVEPDDFVRSDCNADGELDIGDPLQLLFQLYVGGARSTCLKACDSNGSGRLDNADVVHTLSYLYLRGDAPPAPFPGCGQDASSLSCVKYDLCPQGAGAPPRKGIGWQAEAPKEPEKDLDLGRLLGDAAVVRGAPMAVALLRDVRTQRLHRDRRDGRFGTRGRFWFGVFEPGIEVSPTTIRFDEEVEGSDVLPGEPRRRGIVLTNVSGKPFDLELLATTTDFRIEPEIVQLNTDESASAWIYANDVDNDDNGEDPSSDELPAVEITNADGVLARLEIVADTAQADRYCSERVEAATDADYIAILRHLYHGDAAPECLDHFDRDGDGAVRLGDVVAALVAKYGS